MSDPDIEIIGSRAEELEKSPLFRLSLSSNELFHSNFIHWLLQHPTRKMALEAQALFCVLLGVPERKVIKALREKDHNDLVLLLGKGDKETTRKVIIENKVKSWRDKDQLGAYSERARQGEELPLLFVLLSMTVPPEAEDGQPFSDSLGGSWLFLSYRALDECFIERLRKVAVKEGEAYLSALLADYSSMIATMTRLLEEDLFPAGNGEKTLGTLTPARIRELSNKLNETCKLNAIFEKGLFERLEGMAAGIMGKKAATRAIECSRGLDDEDMEKGSLNISSGYSNSGQKGYLNLVYRCENDLVIGVQIEGGQYRHFISNVKKGISVEEYVDSYFDPRRVGARNVPKRWTAGAGMELDAPAGNSRYIEYCSFEKKHFLYLHTSIEDKPMSEILEVAVEDVLLQAERAAYLVRRSTTLTERPRTQ